MWWHDYDDLVDEDQSFVTIEIHTAGFAQEPGFYPLKETRDMKHPQTDEEIRRYRQAADLTGAMPAVDEAIAAMRKTVEVNVFAAIRKGELTPEQSMAYWMEIYAINRLNTRLNEIAAPANEITERKELNPHG